MTQIRIIFLELYGSFVFSKYNFILCSRFCDRPDIYSVRS